MATYLNFNIELPTNSQPTIVRRRLEVMSSPHDLQGYDLPSQQTAVKGLQAELGSVLSLTLRGYDVHDALQSSNRAALFVRPFVRPSQLGVFTIVPISTGDETQG